MTEVFLEISGGNAGTAAEVLSNFATHQVVKPFLYQADKTVVERFGKNCQSTVVLAAKKACAKGFKGRTNLLRREIIAAGANGPLAKEKVGDIFVILGVNI